MRFMASRVQGFLGGVAIAVGVFCGFVGVMAVAQTPNSSSSAPAAQLVGATAFSAEGTEIGVVSAVSVANDGLITQIRVTMALPLGFGERTVAIEKGNFVPFGGGVMLNMSMEEIDALPVPAVLRSTSA
jgi:hypothetical protein